MRWFKSMTCAALVLVIMGVSGCQNAQPQSPAVAAPSTQAVTCSKCQITYFKVPVTGQGKYAIRSYRTVKSMECPDCKSAVANFFTTGKLEHACKTCGNSLEICELH